MKPLVKAGLVFAGYIIAAAVAAGAVACHMIATGGTATQTSSGMNAFGDSLLFLAVFAVAAIPPTGAALFFLRPYQAFWRGLSAVALVCALAGVAAFIGWAIDARFMAGGWAFFGIFPAPFFALAFGLSGFFAPTRTPRMALLMASGTEATVFAGWVITCLFRNLTSA